MAGRVVLVAGARQWKALWKTADEAVRAPLVEGGADHADLAALLAEPLGEAPGRLAGRLGQDVDADVQRRGEVGRGGVAARVARQSSKAWRGRADWVGAGWC